MPFELVPRVSKQFPSVLLPHFLVLLYQSDAFHARRMHNDTWAVFCILNRGSIAANPLMRLRLHFQNRQMIRQQGQPQLGLSTRVQNRLQGTECWLVRLHMIISQILTFVGVVALVVVLWCEASSSASVTTLR